MINVNVSGIMLNELTDIYSKFNVDGRGGLVFEISSTDHRRFVGPLIVLDNIATQILKVYCIANSFSGFSIERSMTIDKQICYFVWLEGDGFDTFKSKYDIHPIFVYNECEDEVISNSNWIYYGPSYEYAVKEDRWEYEIYLPKYYKNLKKLAMSFNDYELVEAANEKLNSAKEGES